MNHQPRKAPATQHDLLAQIVDRLDELAAMVTSVSGTPEQRWLTVEQAASYSGVSAKSIRRLLSSGQLTPYRPCRGRILIDRRQLDAVISSATSTPRRGRGRA